MNGREQYAAGYPIKIVRDIVGDRLGGNGTLTYEPLNDPEQHLSFLGRKLVEEAAEHLATPSLGELADVYEVLRSIATVRPDITLEDVVAEADRKRAERGGYRGGIVMVAHHPADGRDLLPHPDTTRA